MDGVQDSSTSDILYVPQNFQKYVLTVVQVKVLAWITKALLCTQIHN